MSKTAVEWLINELELYKKGKSEYFSEVAIINHAFRIEKQQIIDFANDWKDDCVTGRYDGEVIELKSAEQ